MYYYTIELVLSQPEILPNINIYMNTYFYELNLPKIFSDERSIKTIFDLKDSQILRKYTAALTEFDHLINPELLAIFDNLKIKPVTIVAFGHANDINFIPKSYVHSDVILKNNKWITVPFSINWEITETMPVWHWYDSSMYQCKYPNNVDYPWVSNVVANGIHYGDAWGFNDSNTAKHFNPIYTYQMNSARPALLNTSEAHTVEYSNLETRLSVSLRFDVDAIPTWESALDKFSAFLHSA